MNGSTILLLIIFLPIISAFFMLMIKEGRDSENVKHVALFTSFIVFLLNVYLLFFFNLDNGNPQFSLWIRATITGSIKYGIGVDGISMALILLTTFLMPLCILASWKSVKDNIKSYMIAFLVLETLILLVFTAQDFFLFYIAFEGSLIPMFLIIGIWGGERRTYASFKFFLYTLLGSVLMLVAIMILYAKTGTNTFHGVLQAMQTNPHVISPTLAKWLFLAFFASFAVKVPMIVVHTWLPDAHVEAPTAGSMILAAVLLKLGGYGFLRFSLPFFPQASHYFSSAILILSIVAIIYASLVAMAQQDIKKLVAYSSVAHMGFVTMGFFSGTLEGAEGAMFVMISHGLVSAGLFYCIGVLYERLHTREIDAYGGLAKLMPSYAFFFFVLTMANVGLPGTSGFIGEFLAIIGTFHTHVWIATISATGIIFSAIYALLLYKKIAFGVPKEETFSLLRRLELRERIIFLPIIGCVLYFGLFPNIVFKVVEKPIENMISTYATHYKNGWQAPYSAFIKQKASLEKTKSR